MLHDGCLYVFVVEFYILITTIVNYMYLGRVYLIFRRPASVLGPGTCMYKTFSSVGTLMQGYFRMEERPI